MIAVPVSDRARAVVREKAAHFAVGHYGLNDAGERKAQDQGLQDFPSHGIASIITPEPFIAGALPSYVNVMVSGRAYIASFEPLELKSGILDQRANSAVR